MARKMKPVSRRGNADLHAAVARLTERAWANTVADWKELEAAVTQLGAAAPKAAKDAVASWKRSMRMMPNPFGA
jgi:hypothetical protein